MTFDPFQNKHAKAILKKACKGKQLTTFRKNFEAVVTAEMDLENFDLGGVSPRLGEEGLALAEVVAIGRGVGGKVELPVAAEDWLQTAPAFDDELAAAALAAVEKIRKRSALAAIAQEMGGWPEWTNYCRGLSARLKKPAKQRPSAPKAEGLDAVIKRLRGKQCQLELENGHVVELRCTDDGQLADDDLADITQLKKLRKLVLENQAITDKSLGRLSSLKQLQALTINECQVKGRGFKDLELPKLRQLEIDGPGANQAIAHAQHLTGLREISFRSSDLTDQGLAKLTWAASLESLDVGQCEKLKGSGLKALASLKKLTDLTAIQVSFSPAGFEALCTLTSLKRLDLTAASLPLKQVPRLGDLKRLEKLELFRIDGLADRHLEFLGELKKLRQLDLGRNEGVTDETVKRLAKLPLLEELSLWECDITPASTDLFLSMKQLRELSVEQTGFSRAAEKRLMKVLRR